MTKIKKIPLNINKKGCTSQSSNCVVWQGPGIPFLNLCKGDSITEVVYNLAMVVDSLYKKLDPDTYNIECLNLSNCSTATFEQIFQALINKVCLLEAGGCNVSVDINEQEGGSFLAEVTNGLTPITYSWTVESTYSSSLLIDQPTNSTVNVSFDGIGSPNFYASLLKVKVTDKNNCTATAYKLITYID